MSASARTPSASAVVAELHRRHATEVRSYVLELWAGDEARTEASVAAFWREWAPPPGSADEILRETVFAGARRQAMAEQRRQGGAATEPEDGGEPDAPDAAVQVAARFRRLTSKQQEMVRLHLRHRFGPDECAEITELSAANAEQLLHTAISRLNGKGADDARLVALALSGATGDQLERESPEARTRIAELRLTVEVTRQVLTRGIDTYRPRKRAGRRRGPWLLLAVTGVVVASAAVWWWRARPAPANAEAETQEVQGSARVALRRAEREKNTGAATEGGGLASALSGAKPTPVATAPKIRESVSASESASVAALPSAARPRTESKAPSGAVERSSTMPTVAAEAAAASEPATPSATGATVAAEFSREPTSEAAGPLPAPSRAVQQRALVEARSAALKSGPLDTAPIAALRRALGAAHWPAAQDVRVADLVNQFPAAEKIPVAAGEPFATRVEASDAPWDPARRLVRVTVQARDDAPLAREAATVILLLDVSGSMAAPNRLPLVQEAVAALLRRLRPEDRIGVVTYAGESTVLLPPTQLTDEAGVRAAINALEAKGRTNGGAGLRQAFAMAAGETDAERKRVVILCTDGDFNMGETTEAQLGALIDTQRERGVKLAIFGFGRADRIDPRLEALAARAQGGSGYVNTRAEAEQALVAQLDTLFAPVATTLAATVEFDPAHVATVRALGEATSQPAERGREFAVAQRASVLPGETITALFEVELAQGAPADGDAWRVRLAADLPARAGQPGQYDGHSSGALEAKDFAAASVDFRFAAAAAAFGEALQAGPETGAARLEECGRWARAALGEDAGGYRAEFLRMVEQARRASGN